MVNTLRSQRGLAYLGVLFLVFLLSLGLGKTLEIYATSVQREKEKDLLAVGALYREAIRDFYLSSPGSIKQYPESLQDLLKDPRSLSTRRYLRQLYPDPVTNSGFLPLRAPQGGIWGVRSSSGKKPFKTAGFDQDYTEFTNATSYGEWHFVYRDDE